MNKNNSNKRYKLYVKLKIGKYRKLQPCLQIANKICIDACFLFYLRFGHTTP